MELDIVLKNNNLASEGLKAIEEQVTRLEKINLLNGNSGPLSQGGGGDDPPKVGGKGGEGPPDDFWDSEFWQTHITNGVAAFAATTTAAALSPLALTGTPGAIGVVGTTLYVGGETSDIADQVWDYYDARSDATDAGLQFGIDPTDFSSSTMLPGQNIEEAYRLFEIASNKEVVDNTEDMASLLASFYFGAHQANQNLLDYGKNALGYLTSKPGDEEFHEPFGFTSPDNIFELGSHESVEEFVNQLQPKYLDVAGRGGEFTDDIMADVQGAFWTIDEYKANTLEDWYGPNWQELELDEPDPIHQMVLDHDQKEQALDAWGGRYQGMADAADFEAVTISVDELENANSVAEDFLGISTYISDQWLEIKGQLVAARDEGLAPLAEDANDLQASFESLRQQRLAEKVLGVGEQESVAPRSKKKKDRQNKRERLEELLFADEPIVPVYQPQQLTREQKADMYAFKGIGLAGGGPLGSMALVGEEGPELIIDGVVIPAAESRRLMALGISPRRRFALGGPLDAAYVPRPVDFDPLNVDHRQAIRERNQAVFVPERQSESKNRDEGGRSKRTQNILGSPEAAPSLRELVMESVAESSQTITETAVGAAAFTQASLASEMLAANINLSRELRQSIQESNQQLLQRVDHLAALTERLILETKRMKIYFRDAVRFIAD